ncbi:hypothetical protein ACHAXS_006417 [Conticribra weissflogii]
MPRRATTTMTTTKPSSKTASLSSSFRLRRCLILLMVSYVISSTGIDCPIGLAAASEVVECDIHANSSFDSISNFNSNSNSISNSNSNSISFFQEVTLRSAPAPSPPLSHGKSLLAFFLRPDVPSLLLSGSLDNADANANAVVEIHDPDPDLLAAYRRQCLRANAAPPTPRDRFFEVVSSGGGASFPGLRIRSRSIVGVKLISVRDDLSGGSVPCFEFVLVKSSTSAVGARWLVWSFDRLMGNDAADSDADRNDEQTTATTSVNRVRALFLNDGSVAFESRASLGVRMDVPNWMRSVIRYGKERSERSGNEALRKVLERDVPPSLERLRDAYASWIEA